jgi:hypothetical protein
MKQMTSSSGKCPVSVPQLQRSCNCCPVSLSLQLLAVMISTCPSYKDGDVYMIWLQISGPSGDFVEASELLLKQFTFVLKLIILIFTCFLAGSHPYLTGLGIIGGMYTFDNPLQVSESSSVPLVN